ncbi:MAG: DUF1080 domain-containing protein [Phycisphaeraceae bacterium]
MLKLAPVFVLLFASSVLAEEKKELKPVAIFDGKTFEGWEGNLDIFRIEDGAIVGGTLKAPIKQNEFLCTKKTYGDFELRLKVKLLGGDKANAGIQFRTKRIPNHHEVSGFQADMGQGWWGSLYDESRRNKILAKADADLIAKVLKKEEWNDYVIRAEGNRIQLFINGQKTVDYTEMDEKIEKTGVIAVQIHGGPASEAWYKDIMIIDLSK